MAGIHSATGYPLIWFENRVLLPGEVLELRGSDTPRSAALLDCARREGVCAVGTLVVDGSPAVWSEVALVRVKWMEEHQVFQLRAFRHGKLVGEPFVQDDRVMAPILELPSIRVYPGQERLESLFGWVGLAGKLPEGASEMARLGGRKWVEAAARLILKEPQARRRFVGCSLGAERVEVIMQALLPYLGQGHLHAEA